MRRGPQERRAAAGKGREDVSGMKGLAVVLGIMLGMMAVLAIVATVLSP